MAALRARRPYAHPSEEVATEGTTDKVEILDHSEQTHVVDDLVTRATRAQREYSFAGVALTALVLLLLAALPLPRALAPPVLARLVALCLTASLARQLYSAHAGTALTRIDVLPALPPAILSLLAWRAEGADVQARLLWGIAPFGVQLLVLVLHVEGRRGVTEAQGLRGLMYVAPEA